MFTVQQPNNIQFGTNAASNYSYPANCLLITSQGAKSRGWIKYINGDNFQLFDVVKPNPTIEDTEYIISKCKKEQFSHVIGIGGGSSLDVAKFVGFKTLKQCRMAGLKGLVLKSKKNIFLDNRK